MWSTSKRLQHLILPCFRHLSRSPSKIFLVSVKALRIADDLISFYAMGLYSKNSASYAKMIIYENNLEITYFSSMTMRRSGGGVGPFERYTKSAGWTHFEKNTCFSRIYKGE